MSKREAQAAGVLIVALVGLLIFLITTICKFFWKFTPWVKRAKKAEAERQRQWAEEEAERQRQWAEEEAERQRQWAQYILDIREQWIAQTNPPLYLDGQVKYIYVYTTDTEKLFNRYKVGETIRSPHDRIKEQDSTSNSTDLILVAYWHAGRASDKDLHKLLVDYGYEKIRKNREWFVIESPLTVIPHMLAIANSI
jgi:Sec-independent protein translocase protein TatA